MSTKPEPPKGNEDESRRANEPPQEPGTNAVEHEPDPHAKPTPDGDPKYIRRSPYTSGNY